MDVIRVRNVHEALPEGLRYLRERGVERDTRNGPVLVAPGPVTTLFERPRERVLYWPQRDANPFFHLAESLWMLAGRNDLAFLTYFVKRMKEYSDDGETLHGAYGARWIGHFGGIDQLATIIQALRENPDDRRNVLQMWDATVDLGRDGRDVPCNTQAYFSRDSEGRLDMTVCNRSNDVIWGAYGANAVHFSYLQEYIAGGIGCEVGRYWQMSNNFHAYLDTFKPLEGLATNEARAPHRVTRVNPYANIETIIPFPLVSVNMEKWNQDLTMFLDEGVTLGLREPFFRKIAHPMFMAYKAFKENGGLAKYDTPLEILGQMVASDWREAAIQWIERRRARYEERMRNEPDE